MKGDGHLRDGLAQTALFSRSSGCIVGEILSAGTAYQSGYVVKCKCGHWKVCMCLVTTNLSVGRIAGKRPQQMVAYGRTIPVNTVWPPFLVRVK